MKHLFVCCDGTWNAPSNLHDGVPVPTNVVKTYNAVTPTASVGPDPVQQLRYYHPGIGSSGSLWRRLLDGATGAGITQHIQSAYQWLGTHFEVTDRVFLLGFSRGAYTARSLVGLLHRVGLVDAPSWPEVAEAYAIYHLGKTGAATDRYERFKAALGGRLRIIPIHFIGVWDTVGALGIPIPIPRRLRWLLPRLRGNEFHDTTLSPLVDNAYQALAIDEHRASFSPTLWELPANRVTAQNVQQVWFPGVHADVGGGYRETGLSDAALGWMFDKLACAGAGLDAKMIAQLRPDPLGVLHDSFRGLFSRTGSQPRSTPSLLPGARPAPPTQALSDTARARHSGAPIAQAPYRETVSLKVGHSHKLTVYAQERWNWTGIFVESTEEYAVTAAAAGTWKDGSILCDARGYRRWWLAPFGRFKRLPTANWFCLCAAIADAHNPSVSGIPGTVTTVIIGLGARVRNAQAGYLYLFANDVESMYFNNRGGVPVEIRRLR